MSQAAPEPVSAPPRPAQAEDRTPYGTSPYYGPGIFLRNCWWVATASAQRLTLLALAPRSSSSRRFVCWIVVWLAVSAALLQFSHAGWHTIDRATAERHAEPLTPQGRGWYHLAGDLESRRSAQRNEPLTVWWNPTQSIVAAAHALAITLIAAASILAWQRRGVERALLPPYRGQGRLEAALHYGMAWLILTPLAALVASLAPIADVSMAAGWPLAVPRLAFYGPAAIIGLVAFCGYWFGLIRAGSTVPHQTRARVTTFFGVWNPLLIAFVAAGLAVGLHYWMRVLSTQLGAAW